MNEYEIKKRSNIILEYGDFYPHVYAGDRYNVNVFEENNGFKTKIKSKNKESALFNFIHNIEHTKNFIAVYVREDLFKIIFKRHPVTGERKVFAVDYVEVKCQK